MTSDEKANSLLPPGAMAVRLRTTPAVLVKLAKRGRVPFTKIGHITAFSVADEEVIRAALVAGGFLKAEPEPAGIA